MSTVAPNTDFTIADIDSTWTAIRIRASDGAQVIGRVTLVGSHNGASPLEVVVAPVECLPALPSDEITLTAATSWSGLSFATGSESVRDAVRLTAAISGDLTGPIDCGTVYRLQVGGAIRAPVDTPVTISKTGR